jgi:Acetokinase family
MGPQKVTPSTNSCIEPVRSFGAASSPGTTGSDQNDNQSLSRSAPGRFSILPFIDALRKWLNDSRCPVSCGTKGFDDGFHGLVMMGARSGDLDTGVLLYVMRQQHYDAAELERMVDTESGLLGVSGLSSDSALAH